MSAAVNFPALALVVSIFAVGAASPGPATLMIVKTAAERGRFAALVLSFGITCGSAFWGVLAGMGFVAILQSSSVWLTGLKIIGGAYLLFMAYRSIRAGLSRSIGNFEVETDQQPQWRALFVKGLLLHLTNPKAPLVWLATLSIGASHLGSPEMMGLAITSCAIAAMAIFTGYAVLFSTGLAMRLYRLAYRTINLVAGGVFGLVGMKLLTSKAV